MSITRQASTIIQQAQKTRKIYLHNMNTWRNNFIIEELRNEKETDPLIIKNIFTGTELENSEIKLPLYFEPNQVNFDYNNQESINKILDNEVFIFDLNESDLNEIEFIIEELKVKSRSRKAIILISNQMTWSNTKTKHFASKDNDEFEIDYEYLRMLEKKKELLNHRVLIKRVDNDSNKDETTNNANYANKEVNDNLNNNSSIVNSVIPNNADNDLIIGNKVSFNNVNIYNNKSQQSILKKSINDNIVNNTPNLSTIKSGNLNVYKNDNDINNDNQVPSPKSKPKTTAKANSPSPQSKPKKRIKKSDKNKEEKEDYKIKLYKYNHTDYKLRTPSTKFKDFVYIENQALAASNSNHYIQSYIVCPGYIYGCGEEFFYDYFKQAWLQDPQELPIFENNKNIINTIHIKDLARVIKRLVEKNTVQKYIFAFDNTVKKSYYDIIKSISIIMGSGRVKIINDIDLEGYENQIPNLLDFQCNLNTMKCYNFFTDFKWHCEKGIIENKEKLKQEFKTYRNIKPFKLLIYGGPSSGKTQLSRSLAEDLKLPYLNIKEIIEKVMLVNKNNNEKESSGVDDNDPEQLLLLELSKEVMYEKERMIDLLVEEALLLQQKQKKKNPPPINREDFNVRISTELLCVLVKKILSMNLYSNVGYVLDGFPRNRYEAKMIFGIENKEDTMAIKRKRNEILGINNNNDNNTTTLNSNLKSSVKGLNSVKNPPTKSNAKSKKELNPHLPEDIIENYFNFGINKEISPSFILKLTDINIDEVKNRLISEMEAERNSVIDKKELKEINKTIEARFTRRNEFYELWNSEKFDEEKYNISLTKYFKKFSIESFNVNGELSTEEQVKNVKKDLGLVSWLIL